MPEYRANYTGGDLAGLMASIIIARVVDGDVS